MCIDKALSQAATDLKKVSHRPLLEAQILLCHCTNLSRVQLVTNAKKQIDTKKYFELVKKRATNYPLEYITQSVSFYDTYLFIEDGVLIARPETELLVQNAIDYIQKKGVRKAAEIGIGSGAVSVCIAKACYDIEIFASDINQKALQVAKKNIDSHGLSEQITLYYCSLLDEIDEEIELLVSNPPYIAKDFVLPENVDYEPKNALFGGDKGDEMLKQIILLAQKRGIKTLMCEMGYDQKVLMKEFFQSLGLTRYEFYKDLNGHDRGFTVYFKE